MADSTLHRRVRAVVSGRVQGVWFRESTRQEAERLGLTGWVRNEPDGTVMLEAQGQSDAVGDLLLWANGGPEDARVKALRWEEAELVEGDEAFVVQR